MQVAYSESCEISAFNGIGPTHLWWDFWPLKNVSSARSPVKLGICYPEVLGNLSFCEARMGGNERLISENPGESPRELRPGNAFSPPRPIVVGLFLDVKGAFPSASPARLVHNMRMKGIPEPIVACTEHKLEGRRTTLKIDDFTSDWFNIVHGIDQGCPLLCIYYLLYNSGAIELANPNNQELASGFIDDIALLARVKTLGEANSKLESMMERPGGMRQWPPNIHVSTSTRKLR
jgi:hypothetical protein